MKKGQLFAPFLMLLAGAVVSIVMFWGNYKTTEVLLVVFCVMIVFYLIGLFIQKKVYSFMEQIMEQEAAAAAIHEEVIEKEAPGTEEEEQVAAEDAGEPENEMQ